MSAKNQKQSHGILIFILVFKQLIFTVEVESIIINVHARFCYCDKWYSTDMQQNKRKVQAHS